MDFAAVPGQPTLVLLSGPFPSLFVRLQEGEEDSMKAFIGVMILLAFHASPAHAATLYVGPGETYTTIQSAIDTAADGDVVIVRDGTYTGTGNRDIDFKGKAIHLKSENGPERCIVDAQGSEAERHRGFIFQCEEGQGSILEGFSIINGYASQGGAIRCYSSPAIIGNVLRNNRAESVVDGNAEGGAICSYSGSPVIKDNQVLSNWAEGSGTYAGSRGGGIFASGSATIIGNMISGNQVRPNNAVTTNQGGGGIYVCSKSTAVIDNVIMQNIASGEGYAFSMTGGGGVYATAGTVTGNTVTGNSGGGAGGGGLYVTGSAVICENLISENSFGYGGGLYADSDSRQAQVTRNTIAGNTAGCGGGMHIRAATVVSNNLIINNNSSQQYGAGAWLDAQYGAAISNCTFVGNVAPWGSTVMVGGKGTISNCILWGNDTIYEIDCSGSCMVRYSNVSGGRERVRSDPVPSLGWGPENTDTDPLFADYLNGDFHLKSQAGRWDPEASDGAGGWVYDVVTSPCIDAGAPADSYANETLPNGGRVNIGAYGNTDQASKSPWVLSVDSSPMGGLGITGSAAGVTDYQRLWRHGETVSLRAPIAVEFGGTTYAFQQWMIDEKPSAYRMTTVQVQMDGHHAAKAIYDFPNPSALPADVNGDCVVNILDLLEVRNKLNTRCSD